MHARSSAQKLALNQASVVGVSAKTFSISVILLKIRNQTAEVNHPPLRGVAVIRVSDETG
jgi:hypothetical protein